MADPTIKTTDSAAAIRGLAADGITDAERAAIGKLLAAEVDGFDLSVPASRAKVEGWLRAKGFDDATIRTLVAPEAFDGKAGGAGRIEAQHSDSAGFTTIRSIPAGEIREAISKGLTYSCDTGDPCLWFQFQLDIWGDKMQLSRLHPACLLGSLEWNDSPLSQPNRLEEILRQPRFADAVRWTDERDGKPCITVSLETLADLGFSSDALRQMGVADIADGAATFYRGENTDAFLRVIAKNLFQDAKAGYDHAAREFNAEHGTAVTWENPYYLVDARTGAVRKDPVTLDASGEPVVPAGTRVGIVAADFESGVRFDRNLDRYGHIEENGTGAPPELDWRIASGDLRYYFGSANTVIKEQRAAPLTPFVDDWIKGPPAWDDLAQFPWEAVDAPTRSHPVSATELAALERQRMIDFEVKGDGRGGYEVLITVGIEPKNTGGKTLKLSGDAALRFMTTFQASGVAGKTSPGLNQTAAALVPATPGDGHNLFTEYYRNLYTKQSDAKTTLHTNYTLLSPSNADTFYRPFIGQYVGRLLTLERAARLQQEGRVPPGTYEAILADPQVQADLRGLARLRQEIDARHLGKEGVAENPNLALVARACADLEAILGRSGSARPDWPTFWQSFDWAPYRP